MPPASGMKGGQSRFTPGSGLNFDWMHEDPGGFCVREGTMKGCWRVLWDGRKWAKAPCHPHPTVFLFLWKLLKGKHWHNVFPPADVGHPKTSMSMRPKITPLVCVHGHPWPLSPKITSLYIHCPWIVDPWDMLNNFCFTVYRWKWQFSLPGD